MTHLDIVARLILVALVAFNFAGAAAARASENDDLYAKSAALRPDQAVWRDAVKPTTEPLTLTVSLALQRVYVFRGRSLIGTASVSTGRARKETPSGAYRILQKARWHRSNLYSNAPMPFMQRLTWDGIALHAGHNPGRPASHGCVRLPPAFARALFGMTSLGDVVMVTDYPDVAIDLDWAAVELPDSTGPRLKYQDF